MSAPTNQTSRCPNCGGVLVFDIGCGLLVCDQCGSAFEVPAEKGSQPAADASQPAADAQPPIQGAPTPEGMGVYRCDSCGADIVAESRTGITVRCHYCHNPVVLIPEISGQYQPDAIVPFTVTREQAIASFERYTARHHFTRRTFYDEANIDRLTGVYLPYFAIDAYLEGEFVAQGDRRRTRSGVNETIVEHNIYSLRRHTSFFIDDYAIEALSQALAQTIVTSVQPFDLTKLSSFDYRYLVGFQAERRDLSSSDLEGRIGSDFRDVAQRLMVRYFKTLNYTTVTTAEAQWLKITSEERKYVLLPIWLFTYLDRAKDKTYYYAVNGQTGEASGILPISPVRAALATSTLLLGGWAAILGTLWAVG
ncbi:MAG: TFIIB-type zinc ribbon-containing protein [Bifidobacteriaceae bacterium]|jgi:ribosomal protein L37AE/L43A|nr:TFIIB-type zinc ribbon-containing protein [Bifidobacteriaceae bacterium]